jgi:hypothetical protein
MITIFSTPRPFKGEFDRIQRNAIQSWKLLGRDCQIILINDECNTTEAVAKELGAEFIKEFKCNEYGTPLLDDVFSQVRSRARYDVLAHVNTDILLFPDFVDTICRYVARNQNREFLLLGRRWNLEVTEKINFDRNDWSNALLSRAKTDGFLHSLNGMDYWVFPKAANIYPPPFCVGRPGMDSWLVFYSKLHGIPVLDATDSIMIIHQQHDYPMKRVPYFEIECDRNVKIAGGRANMLSMREADWLLTASGNLVRPSIGRRCLSLLARYKVWRNFLASRRWLKRIIAGSSR